MRIALVNTNRIVPPIAPIGLEYIAEVMSIERHDVLILDLCWEEEWQSAIASFFNDKSCDLIGVTLRNTDDCAFTTRQSFVDEFSDIVDEIRKCTNGLIVVGGVGFSTLPEEILRQSDADIGIWGDGEFAFTELARRLDRGLDWGKIPNLIWKQNERIHKNPPRFHSLDHLPSISRRWIENVRYFREGGQIGFETKRGCNRNCIYCADPIARGKQIRSRQPKVVADELTDLLEQGIDHLHTCDSEFNIPEEHATEICKEIIRRGLGDHIHWYAYCTPRPFSIELAKLMRRSGCVGINFGVDNGDDTMLRRLKRDFTSDDILNAARFCREVGILVMFDLLLGSPGESRESIVKTIELMKRADPDSVGVVIGVRVYPGTELAELVKRNHLRMGLCGSATLIGSLFFLEPEVSPFVSELLDKLIAGDQRFLFFNPENPNKNYNYNANQRLVEAIRSGYRGAYWDILRRIEGE
jgi:radical SAM superfamily enzyme YgiQ (UPF0313 family)